MIVEVSELQEMFGPGKPYPFSAIAQRQTGRRDVEAMMRMMTAADERLQAIGARVLVEFSADPWPAPENRQLLIDAVYELQYAALAINALLPSLRRPGLLTADETEQFTACMLRLMEAIQEMHEQGAAVLLGDFLDDFTQQ